MVKCKFCKKEITKDRFCVYLELERQDVPPNGRWQKSCERTNENVCPRCKDRIVHSFDQIIFALSR